MNARRIHRVSHSGTFISHMGHDRGEGSVERKAILSRPFGRESRATWSWAILTWPPADKRTNDILPYRVPDSGAHLRFNERMRRALSPGRPPHRKRRVTVRHNVIPRRAFSAEGLSKNIFIIPPRGPAGRGNNARNPVKCRPNWNGHFNATLCDYTAAVLQLLRKSLMRRYYEAAACRRIENINRNVMRSLNNIFRHSCPWQSLLSNTTLIGRRERE